MYTNQKLTDYYELLPFGDNAFACNIASSFQVLHTFSCHGSVHKSYNQVLYIQSKCHNAYAFVLL